MRIKHPIKLKTFQKQGVRIIAKHNGIALLADEMRLGKTVQTLQYIKQHITKGSIVIVCPSIAKWVWQEQARNNFGIKTVVLEGSKPDKDLLRNNRIFIINYEILHHWVFYLKRLRPHLVVMDECHYCKSPTAKRTKSARRLAKGFIHLDDSDDYRKLIKKVSTHKKKAVKKSLMLRAPHIIAISGTPLVNRPMELFVVLNILWPKIFRSYPEFGDAYCLSKIDHGKVIYYGERNLDDLHIKLKKLGMIRRLKKDVIKNYKEPITTVIPIDMKNPTLYKRTHTAYVRAVCKAQGNTTQRLDNFLKLKQIAAETKLPAVLEWIDNYLEETEDKLVIFAHHKKIVHTIKNKYKEQSVVIDGNTNNKQRVKAQTRFRKDKSCRLFIGNMQACGVAVSLKAADTVMFAELPLTPAELRQCEDRIFDIGKTKQLFVYHLVAKGTIEEIVCKILQRKAKVISDVMDGKNKGININLYERLEKAIIRKRKTLWQKTEKK